MASARQPNERQRRIADWYAADPKRTIPQAAARFHVVYDTVADALAACGVERHPKQDPNAERNARIRARLAAGRSQSAVAREFHLTRQRIHQILRQG